MIHSQNLTCSWVVLRTYFPTFTSCTQWQGRDYSSYALFHHFRSSQLDSDGEAYRLGFDHCLTSMRGVVWHSASTAARPNTTPIVHARENLVKGVFGTVPVFSVPVRMSYRTYRSVRYRYWCRIEVTEVSGTGIDALPNLPKRPVPLKDCTGTGGTGIHIPVVPNLPKCPGSVWMSYRTYRSVRYRYWCTGIGTGTDTDLDLGTYTAGIGKAHIRYFTAVPDYVVLCTLFKRYPLEYQLEKKLKKNPTVSFNLKKYQK